MAQAHHHPARAKFVAGGVRGGKSLGTSMELVTWARHSNLVWLAANSYDLCRQEFEYITEAMLSLELTDKSLISIPKNRYNPCSLTTIFGSRYETRSLKDVEAFAARAPDVVAICEPGQAPPESLKAARERLSTRRGLLWMAGTFEDIPQAWVEDVFRRWVRWPNPESGKSWAMPSWLNRRSFPGGRQDPEMIALQNSYPNIQEFLLRCAGIPVASSALVIGDYWNPQKHVVPQVHFRPVHDGGLLPVQIAIDPGFSGGSNYVVLAIQHIGPTAFIIDEVSVQGKVHEEVIELCKQRPWWPNVIKSNGGTMDPYASQSHWYGSLSPAETWERKAGIRLRIPPRLSVEDTVSILCTTLRDPQTAQTGLVVSPKAQRLIWEMTHWRKKRTQGGSFAEPTKNNCDAVKALGYYLADRQYVRLAGGTHGQPRVREYTFT